MKISGFARFDKQEVVDCCTTMITRIRHRRRVLRREKLNAILENQTWWWSHFWKWVGLGLIKRPTIKNALFVYLGKNGEIWPEKWNVKWAYGECEDLCNSLIRTAKACRGNSMFLSPETATSILI